MDKKFEPLFTPWKIRDVEIKNRIVLCPMGGTSLFGWMEPHHLDKDAAAFFLERAKNNVGLIIPGIAPLKNLIGGQWLYKAKGAFRKLKPYMEEIHKTGAKLFVQLTAGFGRSFALSDLLALPIRNKFVGALMKPILDPSYISAAPSELPSRWTEDVTCRALTKKEIEDIIYAYAQTAKMCKEAGVDGVEVHAVHEGYLLDQFTLKYTNKRTDEYGGSFENRYRFPVAVVKAIKAECGEDYPVSLRYSVVSKTKGFCQGAVPGEEDYVEVGRDMEESEKAAKYLQDAGYDMLNADNGTYDAWYWAHPPAYMPQNCNLEDVAHIKKFVDIPVVCAWRRTPRRKRLRKAESTQWAWHGSSSPMRNGSQSSKRTGLKTFSPASAATTGASLCPSTKARATTRPYPTRSIWQGARSIRARCRGTSSTSSPQRNRRKSRSSAAAWAVWKWRG